MGGGLLLEGQIAQGNGIYYILHLCHFHFFCRSKIKEIRVNILHLVSVPDHNVPTVQFTECGNRALVWPQGT